MKLKNKTILIIAGGHEAGTVAGCHRCYLQQAGYLEKCGLYD